MRFFIRPKPPFNFDLVAGLYSRFPVQCVDLYSKGIYERALRIKEKIYLVRVRPVDSLSHPKLLVEISSNNLVDRKSIKKKIEWMMGTKDDVKEFYRAGLKDKKFAPIIRNFYGLRAPKTPTIFEALIIAITEQQIALPVAISMRKRLVEKYGDSIKTDHKKYYTFPSPESLAKAKVEEVRELKFSSQKSNYLVDVSKMVFNGEIDLEEMKKWDKEEIINTLTKIKGIGPWTVEYMMCRGMGRYDALPANDMGLRMGVTKYLNKRERVSEKEVRDLLEPFGKYQGYAAFYLIYTYAFKKYPQEKLF